MLTELKTLMDYKLEGVDGDLGNVVDYMFDEESWTVRYMVVKTGSWLMRSRVLLSPQSIKDVDDDNKTFRVDATQDAVERSPSVDTEVPVARESELLLMKYWQWAPYWRHQPVPEYLGRSVGDEADETSRTAMENEAKSHLRSVKEVTSYHVQATDGEIGHVSGLICDSDNWVIRYAVVDTRNWLPGKHILLSPKWILEIRWSREVFVADTTRAAIREAPAYDDSEPITREYEKELHEHFSRQGYWEQQSTSRAG